ncbi:hypothetical protein QQ045_004157 [Rhodiola kirilowii]
MAHDLVADINRKTYGGRSKISYFQRTVEVVQNKVAGWHKNFLSMGGWATLISAVLSSMCIHTLAVIPVPKGVIFQIEHAGADSRRHWINWTTICYPKAEKGLGIRSLKEVWKALRAKLAGRYLYNDSLWAKYARNRFSLTGKKSSLWKSIRTLVQSLRLESTWELHSGNIEINLFCEWIDKNLPASLKDTSVKGVMQDHSKKAILMDALPPTSHMIFYGVKALKVWKVLVVSFHERQPRTLNQFRYYWLVQPSTKSFLGCLKITTACMGLWSVWKVRNAKVHDQAYEDKIYSLVSINRLFQCAGIVMGANKTFILGLSIKDCDFLQGIINILKMLRDKALLRSRNYERYPSPPQTKRTDARGNESEDDGHGSKNHTEDDHRRPPPKQPIQRRRVWISRKEKQTKLRKAKKEIKVRSVMGNCSHNDKSRRIL